MLLVLVLELVVDCGSCLRAGQESECLSVAIVSSTHHGRNAMSLLSCFSCLCRIMNLSSYLSLGCGHHGLEVDIDAVLTRMFQALCDQLYWDRN
jgi:hypothetical protein